MSLKILHTGDLHIGMKFNHYPQQVKEKLVEARFETLKKLIAKANDEQCNIFAVAGDLFEKITVPKRTVERVLGLLDSFAGDCALILPGNHDYDNGMVDLWQTFKSMLSDKMLLLNEKRVYRLKDTHDLDVAVYPAFCHSKHSKENNLGWIKEIKEFPEVAWHIGMAHGALEGLSPDINNDYYAMTGKELASLPFDLWLMGHTHVPYPPQDIVTASTVFNAGTPEPDGMDCRHEGAAWLIELKEDKTIHGQQIKTGTFSFIDTEIMLKDIDSFEKIKQLYPPEKADSTLLRVRLKGRIDRAAFHQKQSFYEELSAELAYFKAEDSGLGLQITGETINEEFTRDSFPHQLLHELLVHDDAEALQVAYDLIQEVKPS